MEKGQEAIYHTEILPKHSNFKKITKVMNLTYLRTIGSFDADKL